MSDRAPVKIKKVIDAPKQSVWDAWTKPELFKQWFMPSPFSVPNAELDVRVGGHLNVDTQGPDGAVTKMTGDYLEVDEPNKLVTTNNPLDKDGKALFTIKHTLILSDQDGKTLLNLTSEVLNAGPEAEPFLAGMEQGLNQALDQLINLVTSN